MRIPSTGTGQRSRSARTSSILRGATCVANLGGCSTRSSMVTRRNSRTVVNPFHAELEIYQQRRDEQNQELFCQIFDFVSQWFVSRETTLPNEREVIDLAIEKFKGRLPEGMIYNLAARQIGIEEERRRIIAALPKPVRRDIFGRPILNKKAV